MYVCKYECLTSVKQTMTPVSVFTRDTHPTKPKECLDDDGVGVQEALADPNFLDLLNGRCFLALYTNFHLIVRTNISIPRLKFFSVMLSPIRFLTRHNRQHVQVASRANQGLWDISNQNGNEEAQRSPERWSVDKKKPVMRLAGDDQAGSPQISVWNPRGSPRGLPRWLRPRDAQRCPERPRGPERG